MHLSKGQLKDLRLILVRIIDPPMFEQIVDDLEQRVDSTIDSYELKMAAVLREANYKGWIDDLIREFMRVRPDDPELKPFVASLAEPAAGAVVDEYGVCIADSRPFIDRTKLRRTLPALVAETNGRRVLLVNGKPQSGKSHTVYLINHLAAWHGFKVVPVDLNEFKSLSPYEIGWSITALMKLPPPEKPGDEQWSRWIKNYFDTFAGQVSDSDKTWWIVMDSFASVTVPEEINAFVEALVSRINLTMTNVRAVLISYDSPLAHNVEPIVARDETDELTFDHLSDFFEQLYREHQPALTEIQRKALAADDANGVLQKIASVTESRSIVMGSELLERWRRIAP